MNKSFLIIFIPAVLVGAAYLAMGIRPPMRVELGIGVVAVALAVWRIRVMTQRGKTDIKKTESPLPSPKS